MNKLLPNLKRDYFYEMNVIDFFYQFLILYIAYIGSSIQFDQSVTLRYRDSFDYYSIRSSII